MRPARECRCLDGPLCFEPGWCFLCGRELLVAPEVLGAADGWTDLLVAMIEAQDEPLLAAPNRLI